MEFVNLAIVSLVILSVFWYSLIFKKSRTVTLPPGPRGLPILGYLPFLRLDLHVQFTELARLYGPIYKLWFGQKLCFVISSKDLIKQVVRDHDTVLANHDVSRVGLIATNGAKDIVFAPYGPYWRDMRKIFVREMLSGKNIDASYNLRKDEVQKTTRKVYAKSGSSVEIGELVFVTVTNVVLNLLWGGTIREEKQQQIGAQFEKVAAKIVDLIGTANISDFFPLLARFDLQGLVKEIKKCWPQVEEIFDYVITESTKAVNRGEKRSDGRKDILQILLELKEKDSSSINLTQIKAILLDIVLGGTDTTATTTEWVMTEILRNPRVMKRVQEELTDIVGINNTVEESQLSKLQYLNVVLKETFRLHPPTPLLVPRIASQSCTVGGYTIPKGSRLFLNTWSIYRDPQVWENPLEFSPERFLNNNNDENGKLFDYSGNNFEYLPFGSGRRICPGAHLAERMVLYILASLLNSFDWKLPDGETPDISDKFGVVTRKTKPLVAVPSPRLSNLSLYT